VEREFWLKEGIMNKYKIGEEVKTEDDNQAFIVGLIMGQSLKRKQEIEGKIYYAWNKNCPGWEEKVVYYVEFMKPVKQAKMKDLMEVYEKMYSVDRIRTIYESQEDILLLAIPEDEIKLANCVG
jgi:hypothetical protein